MDLLQKIQGSRYTQAKKTLKINNLDFFELWVRTGLDSVEKISKFIESVATFHFVVGLHFLEKTEEIHI